MQRQKIRRLSLLVSFLLLPVTLYYFSPYLIIEGAGQGIITGSFVVFALLLLISLVLGRAFCGWVCPAGGLQECAAAVSDRPPRGGRLNWIKYILWLLWLGGIGAAATAAGGLHRVDFFYATTGGISVGEPQAYIIYFFIVGLVLLIALPGGRRAFCHYGCWMAPFMVLGTRIKEKLGYPSLGLGVDSSRCTGCQLCSRQCPTGLDVSGQVRRGGIDDPECILCANCADVCPRQVITFGFRRRPLAPGVGRETVGE